MNDSWNFPPVTTGDPSRWLDVRTTDPALANGFLFQGTEYGYQRTVGDAGALCVEVPIALRFLFEHLQKRILEIGGVLTGFENELSRILGLNKRVIVADISPDHPPDETFDIVVAVAVVARLSPPVFAGAPSDDLAPLRAIAGIYRLLAPGGRALVTVPYGKLMRFPDGIQFSRSYLQRLTEMFGIPTRDLRVSFLKKHPSPFTGRALERWVEAGGEEVDDVEYGVPCPGPGCIAVIDISRSSAVTVPLFPRLSSAAGSLRFARSALIGSWFDGGFRHEVPMSADGWLYVYGLGTIWFGPYMLLPAGRYRLVADIECEGSPSMRLDVTGAKGAQVFWETVVSACFQTIHLREEFSVPGDIPDMEFRAFLMYDGGARIRVRRLELRPC